MLLKPYYLQVILVWPRLQLEHTCPMNPLFNTYCDNFIVWNKEDSKTSAKQLPLGDSRLVRSADVPLSNS